MGQIPELNEDGSRCRHLEFHPVPAYLLPFLVWRLHEAQAGFEAGIQFDRLHAGDPSFTGVPPAKRNQRTCAGGRRPLMMVSGGRLQAADRTVLVASRIHSAPDPIANALGLETPKRPATATSTIPGLIPGGTVTLK